MANSPPGVAIPLTTSSELLGNQATDAIVRSAGKRSARVRLAHERFADEKRMEAGLAQLCNIGCAGNATLCYTHHARRNMLCQCQRSLQRDFERVQVAIVHADDVRSRRDGEIQFAAVMDFHQRGHSEARRCFAEVANLAFGNPVAVSVERETERALNRSLSEVSRLTPAAGLDAVVG